MVAEELVISDMVTSSAQIYSKPVTYNYMCGKQELTRRRIFWTSIAQQVDYITPVRLRSVDAGNST